RARPGSPRVRRRDHACGQSWPTSNTQPWSTANTQLWSIADSESCSTLEYCQGMAREGPTPTSHALLGLLAIRPWTAYELTRQVTRSMRYFWPRSAAHVYGELKRLERLGLAAATVEHQGSRPRTSYQITEPGR